MSAPDADEIVEFCQWCFEIIHSMRVCAKLLHGQELSDLKLRTEELHMMLSDYLTELQDRKQAYIAKSCPKDLSAAINVLTECVEYSRNLCIFVVGLHKRGLCTSREWDMLKKMLEDLDYSFVTLRIHLGIHESRDYLNYPEGLGRFARYVYPPKRDA
ncbi:hypothetical protein EJ06DRAFT_529973 [Trichodelitschia bisporula]|uniref:Uncharacterized protein n=1 Tax=Trichodelitschia bisporula TaxID=703511 RepID=A0A6G1HXU8_9PEZI|nr:hypothetical protein EJ06DRAFT_529973 [Trichodelitschia bisporula]